ncbi:hypothetical protein BDV06DRAFT_234785 [Aspergillus oleicola]
MVDYCDGERNDLVEFLPRAQWQPRGQHTSICDDENLEPILVKFGLELPSYLRGFGLQAWKTTGHTRILEKGAYILPVSIITGTPRILDGPLLIPRSVPFHCEDQTIISGSLYYILASPPGTNLTENYAES